MFDYLLLFRKDKMVMETIKVLILVPDLQICNGVASFAMNYYRKLDHNIVHMDFVVWKDTPTPYYDEIEANGSKVFVLPSLKNFKLHMKECKRILSEGNYDIIHDNTLLISYPIMHEAMKQNVAVRILHSHSSKLGETCVREMRNRFFFPLLKRTATDYAACSEISGRFMFGDKKFDLISNVIFPQKFIFSEKTKIETRREMSAEKKIIIGSVGRIASPKNPLFALEVIKYLVKQNDTIEYWWIGDGPMKNELYDKIVYMRLEQNVKLLGSRDDVADLYQAMDLFFMPSKFEGFPIACIEAQTSGLPCIVSDVLPPELNINENVRFVSLNAPPESWAQAISTALCERVDREKAFEKVNGSIYSDQNAGERLTQYYMGLMQENRELL